MIEWKDGPLLKAVKYGYSGVFDNINLAQTKVIERLNSLLEPEILKKKIFLIFLKIIKKIRYQSIKILF